MCKLQQYLAQDTSVIIATASPDNFVSGIVETLNLPDIFIIGTRICRHTGNIIGEECSRENKWIRVSNHAEKTGAKKIIAYGNEPDDLVLLKKADEGYIVNQQSIKPIKSS
jgi:phosphoserine phosphatase